MKKIFFIIYSLVLLLLVVFSYAFVDSNLIYYKNIFSGFATQNRGITTFLYLSFVVILCALYLFVLRFVKKKQLTIKSVYVLVGIICTVLVFSYPAMLSYDIFNYITTAKVLFFYHENPYLIMPIEFIGDPYLLFTHAANKIALYGPGWIVFSAVPHHLGLGNFVLTLLSFKLVSAVFYLLTIWMLWKLSKNLYTISLFAFNPLVIIELLVSAHNDIVMVFLLLLSYFLLQKKKYLWSVVMFILSVLIKYATLFVLPVFIYLLWKAYKNQEIEWKKVYYWSAIAMFVIFLLSPLREEMYPWYAIWFLPFVFLAPNRNILYISMAFTFGLLLRYIPFMYTGNHFGITPILRIVLALIPVLIVGGFILLKKRLGARV